MGRVTRRSAALSAVAVIAAVVAGDLASAGPATGQRRASVAAPARPAKKRPPERFICQARSRGQKASAAKRHPIETVICKRGPTGPQGPQGPPGPTGSGSPGPQRVIVPRTTIPFTNNFMTDGGNVQNLVKIGPIHIDGLCRRTFSPGTGGGESSGGDVTHPDPRLPTAGGESEAQILIWTETGSLTFKGQVGPRKNVPPGQPDYTVETGTTQKNPGGSSGKGTDQPVSDPVAGEGNHLFLAASNEGTDEDRATDPAADNPNNPSVRKLSEYPAFQFAGGFIGTSDGHAVLADMVGGFDVLGVYGECVFGGVVRTL